MLDNLITAFASPEPRPWLTVAGLAVLASLTIWVALSA